MFRSPPENVWHAEYKLMLPSACHTFRFFPDGPGMWGALGKELGMSRGKGSFLRNWRMGGGTGEVMSDLAPCLDFPEVRC